LQIYFNLFLKSFFLRFAFQYFKLTLFTKQPLFECPVLFGAAKVQTFLLLANLFQFILKSFFCDLLFNISNLLSLLNNLLFECPVLFGAAKVQTFLLLANLF